MGTGGGGNEQKAVKDSVSEITTVDRRSRFEVDELTGQSKHKAKVGESTRVSTSKVNPEDIMITRE